MEPRDSQKKVKQARSSIPFPTTKQDIIAKSGNAQVEVAAGKKVSVRDALQPVSTTRFESPGELLNELNAAHHLNWPEL